jgi:L-cystine uptake protein TcyP (sodium:dicarboxylate symporter family)
MINKTRINIKINHYQKMLRMIVLQIIYITGLKATASLRETPGQIFELPAPL